MTKIEQNKFRKMLEARRAELGSGNPKREALAIETSPDELDRIQDAGNRDWAMGNLERNGSRLREVEAALRRVNTKAFGICENCEGNISPRRLAAVPWVSLCIRCQEVVDRDRTAPQDEIDPSIEVAA